MRVMGSPATIALSPTGTVLVVDDSDVILQIVSAQLDGAGWRAHSADTLPRGLEQLRHRAFDAAIVDLHMPEGGGIEFLRRVREIDATLPVVILSGDGDLSAILSAVRAGAFDYVSKADDYAPLLAAVERAATHARIARENLALETKLRDANHALEVRTQVLARQADALLAQHHELGEKNRELEAASQRKSELLARIDGDLREPLSAIAAAGALIIEEDGAKLGAATRTRVEKIVSTSSRVLGTLDDLSSLSKFERSET